MIRKFLKRHCSKTFPLHSILQNIKLTETFQVEIIFKIFWDFTHYQNCRNSSSMLKKPMKLQTLQGFSINFYSNSFIQTQAAWRCSCGRSQLNLVFFNEKNILYLPRFCGISRISFWYHFSTYEIEEKL